MTQRELLKEQYEDALFALLMDEVAVLEGEKALRQNMQLQEDPNAAVPEIVLRRCKRALDKKFRARSARKVGRASAKVLQIFAVVFMTGVLSFSAAFAASPAVRVNTLNLCIDVFDMGTFFTFQGKTSDRPEEDAAMDFSVNWLPADYQFESRSEDHRRISEKYVSSSGGYILIRLFEGSGGSFGADTEDAQCSYININGHQAVLAEKDSSIQISWGIVSSGHWVSMISEGIEREDMIHIAENLSIQ